MIAIHFVIFVYLTSTINSLPDNNLRAVQSIDTTITQKSIQDKVIVLKPDDIQTIPLSDNKTANTTPEANKTTPT